MGFFAKVARALTHGVAIMLLGACAARPAATPEPRAYHDAQRDPGRTLRVLDAWSRPTPGADEHSGHSETGAIYLTIVSSGTQDRLTGVSGPDAATYELHESREINGMMRMDPLPGGVPIPAGAAVALSPGAKHIMMTGLKRTFKEGDVFVVTLTFESGRVITPEVRVRGP
jgi:hypothetical protein